MFDIAPTEFLLVAFVALVVIGPKDLPKAMRVVGYWVGRARAVGRQFRAGFDEMIRESELAEMEKKWQAENERIMREHPATSAAPVGDDAEAQPVMVEQPHLTPSPTPLPASPEQQQLPLLVDHPAVAPADAAPASAAPPADKAPS